MDMLEVAMIKANAIQTRKNLKKKAIRYWLDEVKGKEKKKRLAYTITNADLLNFCTMTKRLCDLLIRKDKQLQNWRKRKRK